MSGVTSSDPGEREAGAGAGKPVSTWSEHVWSTFIHRGYSDDVTERPDVVVGKGRIKGSQDKSIGILQSFRTAD